MEHVEWSELPLNAILIIKEITMVEGGRILQLRDAKKKRNYSVLAPGQLCTDICIGDVICRENAINRDA